jgi:serine/threonine-protein kinase
VIGSPAKYCQKFTNGSFKVLLSIPIKATNPIDNLVDIQSGEQFSCALRKTSSSSDLYCWGLNDKGQLGIDTVGLLSTHAIKAHLPGDVESFSVTHANVCAVLKPQTGFRAGRLFCWGDNSNNQLGFASTSAIPAASGKPKEIPLIVYEPNNFGSSAILTTTRSPLPVYGHQVKYSDYNNVSAGGRTLNPASISSTPEIVKKISIGFELDRDALPTKFSGCFVTDSKNVYCWGANTYGQVGTGYIHIASSPVNNIRPRNVLK